MLGFTVESMDLSGYMCEPRQVSCQEITPNDLGTGVSGLSRPVKP